MMKILTTENGWSELWTQVLGRGVIFVVAVLALETDSISNSTNLGRT